MSKTFNLVFHRDRSLDRSCTNCSVMVAARVNESSSSFDLTDDNIGLEPRLNTSYPLSLEEDKSSRKFKWQSGFNELKSFVNDELGLSGQCSSVSKSGGFLVFKANGVTLSFYPKTKTLNVQGGNKKRLERSHFLFSRVES